MLTLTDAREYVVGYLQMQEDSYFEERETTKEAVLANDALIDAIACEHAHCVSSFGLNWDWSLKDACDNDPGIWQGVIPEEREYQGGFVYGSDC